MALSFRRGTRTVELVNCAAWSSVSGATLDVKLPPGEYISIGAQLKHTVTDAGISAGETIGGAVLKCTIGDTRKPFIDFEKDEVGKVIQALKKGSTTGRLVDVMPTTATEQVDGWQFDAIPGTVFRVPEGGMFHLALRAATDEWGAASAWVGSLTLKLVRADEEGLAPALFVNRAADGTSAVNHVVNVGPGSLRGLFVHGTVSSRLKALQMYNADGGKEFEYTDYGQLNLAHAAYCEAAPAAGAYYVADVNVPFFPSRSLTVQHSTADTVLAFAICVEE